MASSDDAATYAAVPGKPALLLGAFDMAGVGYVAEEFFISGIGPSYTPRRTGIGWLLERVTGGGRDYTTRIVVLTPADRSRFNGTVLVEWLNVSGGIDAPAVWMMAHREMRARRLRLRRGVGASASASRAATASWVSTCR